MSVSPLFQQWFLILLDFHHGKINFTISKTIETFYGMSRFQIIYLIYNKVDN